MFIPIVPILPLPSAPNSIVIYTPASSATQVPTIDAPPQLTIAVRSTTARRTQAVILIVFIFSSINLPLRDLMISLYHCHHNLSIAFRKFVRKSALFNLFLANLCHFLAYLLSNAFCFQNMTKALISVILSLAKKYQQFATASYRIRSFSLSFLRLTQQGEGYKKVAVKQKTKAQSEAKESVFTTEKSPWHTVRNTKGSVSRFITLQSARR